jgi:hypothetical protein
MKYLAEAPIKGRVRPEKYKADIHRRKHRNRNTASTMQIHYLCKRTTIDRELCEWKNKVTSFYIE